MGPKDNDSGDMVNHLFQETANVITDLLIEEREPGKGSDRPVERASQLVMELSECTHPTSQHFLGELPKHCSMLLMAIHDSCTSLNMLNRSLPFSSTLLARGLLEAAADLYWLTDTRIDKKERVRRTFLVYLIQVETQVRRLEQYRNRRLATDRPDLDRFISQRDLEQAISEGWAYLRESAEAMATVGYELNESKKLGVRYSLGERKPTISKLVDDMATDLLGSDTRLNLYSHYSSAAHVEGEGLGNLRDLSDMIATEQGEKHAYSFSEARWMGEIAGPGIQIAMGAVRMWVRLGFPTKLDEFDAKCDRLVQAANRSTHHLG